MATATICWSNNTVKIIDQTKLPQKFEIVTCKDVKALWKAIKCLSVRGAPALGVAAGFGILLGIKEFKGKPDMERFKKHVMKVSDYLATSRPTAVNLFNVLEHMRFIVREYVGESIPELTRFLKDEAMRVYEEDRMACRQMGDHGSKLIKKGMNILTICNAGALATVDYGTALGVMYSAKSKGKDFSVYACETRPLLQGARLTAWELMRAKIDVTLICDNMAATLMGQGKIDIIFVGADRIALNGDTANKIGTYNLAVLAHYHKIPFYVVAPLSTFDAEIATGAEIPIEERSREEVINFRNINIAPQKVNVYNPAFDVTDSKLITGIVTEEGIIEAPFKKNIRQLFSSFE